MGNISPATSDPLYSLLGLAASAPSTSQPSSPSTNTLEPAASVELAALQSQSSTLNTLLAGPSVDNTPASLFAGGSILSLLNAKGTSAMAYLTPQLPSVGQNVNALA